MTEKTGKISPTEGDQLVHYDPEKEGPALIFDGVCGLCNGAVDFILARENGPALTFIPWQSTLGKSILSSHGMWQKVPDALVLLVDGRVLKGSDAALEAGRWLRFPWSLLPLLRWVPRFLREPVYRFVARIRYRWFGRLDTCRIPEPGVRHRFRDGD